MSIYKLKSLLREKIKFRTLQYLTEKRKRKGQEIEYLNFQRADYLVTNALPVLGHRIHVSINDHAKRV